MARIEIVSASELARADGWTLDAIDRGREAAERLASLRARLRLAVDRGEHLPPSGGEALK